MVYCLYSLNTSRKMCEQTPSRLLVTSSFQKRRVLNLRRAKCRSRLISALEHELLATIELNDEPGFQTDKIEDTIFKGKRALEFQTAQLLVADCLPQRILGQCRILAHMARKHADLWCYLTTYDCLLKFPSLAISST